MDGGAWRATVHGVAQSQTGLSRHEGKQAPPPKLLPTLLQSVTWADSADKDWILTQEPEALAVKGSSGHAPGVCACQVTSVIYSSLQPHEL